MTEQANSFDPYELIPFVGYGSAMALEGERYLSLMHFIESEKFRGVDDGYRKYLMTLDDPIDFRLETAGVSQCKRRADWEQVRSALIYSGLWMQLAQNQDLLCSRVLVPDSSSGIELVDEAARYIYARLLSAQSQEEPLRRVVITGDMDLDSPDVLQMIDSIFSSRLPDELIVTTEQGIAQFGQAYALRRYLPIRTIADQPIESMAEYALSKASHVFSIGRGELPNSAFASLVLKGATDQGKVSHHIVWKD